MTVALGEQAALVARLWIGTPYLHQGSSRAAGTDCLGLIRGVWRDLWGTEPELPPDYSRDWSEASGEEVLWYAARRHLIAQPLRGEWNAGDILLFRMRAGSVAKHLGILARSEPEASFVHAYCGHGVVESQLGVSWRRRVVARFEFPKEFG